MKCGRSFKVITDLPTINGPAMVMGSAPSLLDVSIENFRGYKIGVGDLPVRMGDRLHFDYWVTANSHFPLPWLRSHQRSMEEGRYTSLVMATSAMSSLSYRNGTRLLNKAHLWPQDPKIVVYDQRHETSSCQPLAGCCAFSHAVGARAPTIQKMFEDQSGIRYEGSHSVAFHGIALALLLGASPVYVAGVELPVLKKDYLYCAQKKIPRGTLSQRAKLQYWNFLGGVSNLRRRVDPEPSMFSFGDGQNRQDLASLAIGAKRMNSRLLRTSHKGLLAEVAEISYERPE